MNNVKVRKPSTTVHPQKLDKEQKSLSTKDFCILECFIDNHKNSLDKYHTNDLNPSTTRSQANLRKSQVLINKRQQDAKYKEALKDKTKKSISQIVIAPKKVTFSNNPERFLQRNQFLDKKKNWRMEEQRRKVLYGLKSDRELKPQQARIVTIEKQLQKTAENKCYIRVQKEDELGVYQQNYYKKIGYNNRYKKLKIKTTEHSKQSIRDLMKESVLRFNQKVKSKQTNVSALLHIQDPTLSISITNIPQAEEQQGTSQCDSYSYQKMLQDRVLNEHSLPQDDSELYQKQCKQTFQDISHILVKQETASFDIYDSSILNRQTEASFLMEKEIIQVVSPWIGFDKKEGHLQIAKQQYVQCDQIAFSAVKQMEPVVYQNPIEDQVMIGSQDKVQKIQLFIVKQVQTFSRTQEQISNCPTKKPIEHIVQTYNDKEADEEQQFVDLIPNQQYLASNIEVEQLHFENLSHQYLIFHYLLAQVDKPVENDDGSEKINTIEESIFSDRAQKHKGENSLGSHAVGGMKEEPIMEEGETRSMIIDEEGETRSIIVDEEGNLIEKIEVEIKHFGLCHIMVVNEQEQSECQEEILEHI